MADSTLLPGKPAPDFTLPDQDNKPVSLKSLRGQTVILYFYPKDDTPGCTTEACGLRDRFPTIARPGIVLYGVSPDSPASHRKFIAKHHLPFSLLSDEATTMLQAYGMWVEKSMYGKKYMGVERSTVVIDPKGRILHVFRKVKPSDHPAELEAFLTQIAS